jgi:hypothetical protein
MQTFWRGEFVWHLKRIASPIADTFYSVSSMILLISSAVATWKRRSRGHGIVGGAVWASVLLSLAALALLSVWFEYGTSFYPSQKEPYFTSGRLIAGALIPFLVLYIDGIAFLVERFSRVTGPLVFVGLTSLLMTVSEVALTREVFQSPFNWFHLP